MKKIPSKIRIGITMGDPSGIGAEIISKALKKVRTIAEYVLIGDRWVFEKAMSEQLRTEGITFIDLKNVLHGGFTFGRVTAEYGRAAIEYLDAGLKLIEDNRIDCLVTAPISKESIAMAGFAFPGHTEYLAQHTGTKNFVMMLLNNKLKISLVTRHVPLSRVPFLLSREAIRTTILLTYDSLRTLFSIKSPRIVVCGLNPHASDNGVIGFEENKIIKPVLESIRRRSWKIAGPLSADIAMAGISQGKFDCAVAMYHDQALIPLKLFGKNTGVNITLGLPFVRTSPLHGTAFDIAGRHIASADSMIEAIKVAVRCSLPKLQHRRIRT